LRFRLFIAKRYLFSRKSTNVINIISGISTLGVSVGTMALVILLSAFNGLESWVVQLYNAFDPDVRIEHVSKKFFQNSELSPGIFYSVKGIEHVIPVLEDNCLLTYKDAQYVCTIKGVGDKFLKISGIDSMLIDGRFDLYNGRQPGALMGSGVAYYLSLGIGDMLNPVSVFVPKSDASVSLNPADAFNSSTITPIGIFEIQPEVDTRYVIVPISFTSELFRRPGTFSSIEIQLKKGADKDRVIDNLKRTAGASFTVKDRFEQHALIYKIINSEKWAVFLILTFILLIAVFNITGSLTMLIVDKSKDIKTLRNLGASVPTLRMIFFMEGLMITLIGLLIGLTLGLFLVWLQSRYSLVMISETDSYPMLVKAKDLISIVITVLIIGAAASWLPALGKLKKWMR
jgi:lipoprotein-releasing system permease protein